MTLDSLVQKLRGVHSWREMAALLFIPADVIWLTGWFCLFSGINAERGYARVLGVFLLSSLLAYEFLKLLNSWQLSAGLKVLLVAVGLLLGTWLGENLLVYERLVFDPQQILTDIWSGFSGLRSLSVEFWALISICVIWLRCIIYTRASVTQDTVLGRLQFDLVAILILLVLPGRPGLLATLIGLSIFLISSLSALSLVRIADINLYRGGKRLSFKVDWLLALVGFSCLLVSFTGIFAFLSSSWLTLAVLSVANAFLAVVRFIIEKLIAPVVEIIAPLLQKIIDLLLHPEDKLKMPELNLEPYKVMSEADKLKIEEMSAESLHVAQPYIMTILLGLVVVGVILMILKKPWKEKLKEIDDVSQEQIEGRFWKRLRDSLTHQIQAALSSIAGVNRARRATGLFRAARIRWIYHELELFSTRRGVPRPAAVTPLEYQSMLVTAFPGGEDDLLLLTKAYLSVRYGELPETAGEVTVVVDAWNRLKSMKPIKPVGKITLRRKLR